MRLSSSWLLWAIASLFYAYQYIIRVMPSILIEPLMVKFSINASDFGQFSGLYYLAYAGFHIPLGMMIDRWGAKKIMVLCLVMIIMGTLPIIWSNHWSLVLIGRTFVGAGSSAAILSAFQLIYQGFEQKYFSRMLGGCVTIGLLGAIYGGQPLQSLIHTQGWTSALKIVLIFGCLLGALIILAVPSLKKTTLPRNMWHDLKATFKNPMVLKICLLAGCMVGPLEGFADVWAKIYFEKVYGFSAQQAAFLPSLIFLGMCIGAPLLGAVAEKFGNYYTILSGAGFIMAGVFFFVLSGQATSGFLALCFVITGILSAYQILAISKATTYVSQELMGITTAWANMVIMVFGYAFHRIISLVIQYYWDGTTVVSTEGLGTVAAYSPLAYQMGLAIIPLGLIIGGSGFWYISRKEHKNIG